MTAQAKRTDSERTHTGAAHNDGQLPTDISREYVIEAAGCGLTDEQIADVVGCSVDTLTLRFADDISRSRAEAVQSMSRKCLQMARTAGGGSDRIFWQKCHGSLPHQADDAAAEMDERTAARNAGRTAAQGKRTDPRRPR